MTATAGDRANGVLTAIVNPSLEASLVAGFTRHDLGVTVVRRCVDLIELLSAAAGGTAQAALISADLRGLDRESVAELARCGLVTVGLTETEADERLLHQLGVDVVVPARAPTEQVAGALLAAGTSGPRPAADDDVGCVPGERRTMDLEEYPPGGSGRVIAVWGPTGAPGRTTVAVGLADALAGRGVSTLLIDADSYGGAVAILTGLVDESPGVAAACRAANAGSLDVARLAGCCREIAPRLRVLTGLSQPSRWPELRPASFERVIALGRWLADVVIIDTGFALEDDEALSYDTLAPRRNAATLTALGAADQVVAVSSADPVGLSRFVRELPVLATILGAGGAELTASGRLLVVANRVRDGLLSGGPRGGAREALGRHAGVGVAAMIPMDLEAADAAHGGGRLLSEVASESALARSLRGLADAVHKPGSPAPDKIVRSHLRRLKRRPRASSTKR